MVTASTLVRWPFAGCRYDRGLRKIPLIPTLQTYYSTLQLPMGGRRCDHHVVAACRGKMFHQATGASKPRRGDSQAATSHDHPGRSCIGGRLSRLGACCLAGRVCASPGNAPDRGQRGCSYRLEPDAELPDSEPRAGAGPDAEPSCQPDHNCGEPARWNLLHVGYSHQHIRRKWERAVHLYTIWCAHRAVPITQRNND